MDIIALTFMTRRLNLKQGLFHFKGVWSGNIVKQLKLSSIDLYNIELEKEYVLHLTHVHYCESKKLILAKIIKARALDI